MTILWPWRFGRLKWKRGIGGVRMSVCNRYVVEPSGSLWRYEGREYNDGRLILIGEDLTRRAAIRECEIYEASRERQRQRKLRK